MKFHLAGENPSPSLTLRRAFLGFGHGNVELKGGKSGCTFAVNSEESSYK